MDDDKFPLPKSQFQDAIVPILIVLKLAKLTERKGQPFVVLETKSIIGLGFVITDVAAVFTQPLLEVTDRVTIEIPALVKHSTGDAR